jgi:hypothetical protein
MRALTLFSKRALTATLLASSLFALPSCGPDYALFKVSVTSSNKDRDQITQCRMTIRANWKDNDNPGELVLDHYQMTPKRNSDGTLAEGCEGAKTGANIGTFDYSTSRSAGTLKFFVEAINGGNDQVLQKGASDAITVRAFEPSKTEIPVSFDIK